MNEKKLTIPFVGSLEVTVHPNGVDEGRIRDMAIDGMREYLNKDLARAWTTSNAGAQRPIEVTVPKLIETFPLYGWSAPDARKWREERVDWSHAWATPDESDSDESADQVERVDDVKELIRELSKHGVTAVYLHTGGGCMVAAIELKGGYFLSSSQPDGPSHGYYWGIDNHEGEALMQGAWPRSDAATAAQKIATLIETLGDILPQG
ncbi:hypothetical protein [Streptomyces sp. NPDC004528]|uniref:hypothetical protein n=1 Tax=Streptomyces sp. NPDC004528 TaxID=3154550 RepID=UPI0033AC0F1C